MKVQKTVIQKYTHIIQKWFVMIFCKQRRIRPPQALRILVTLVQPNNKISLPYWQQQREQKHVGEAALLISTTVGPL